MPREINLVGQAWDVLKGTTEVLNEESGELEEIPTWTVVLQCPVTHDVTSFTLDEGAKNRLVGKLTGGVVLPDGVLPA